ncbi:MAG: hypothetical protein SGARI_006168, partial [Bacillariaceae sp.]
MPKTKKKSQTKKGARTGVETKANNESIEEWIDSTKSPGRDSATEDDDDNNQQRKEPKTPAAKKKKKTKTPKESVSMKLRGADDEDEASGDQGGDRRSASSAARNYARKVTRSGKKSDLTSPSDLSRVSTAAPSPALEQDVPQDDNDDNDNNFPTADGEESDVEVEQPLLTQEEEEGEAEASKDEVVAKQAAANESGEKLELASPEDFNMGGHDYESDEGEADPLAPPMA